VGPRLLNATTCAALFAIGSLLKGATGKSPGHQSPYFSLLNSGRRFSQAPSVMQFFAVPGEVTLIALIFPSPSLSIPSLPAAMTKQKSL
jgi:hypothetical protein